MINGGKVYGSLGELSKEEQTGGSSIANTIASLGLLGAQVSYCSQVGNDNFGQGTNSNLKMLVWNIIF